MVFRVFYEASRNLDSRPPLRIDHVEACRPQGCAVPVYRPDRPVSGAAGLGLRPDVRAALACLLGHQAGAHQQPEHLAAEAEREHRLERRGDDEEADEDVARRSSRRTPSARTAAAVVTAAPIPWAKRFGGPATYLGGPRRGATTLIATRPSGLSLGPVRTRAQKP